MGEARRVWGHSVEDSRRGVWGHSVGEARTRMWCSFVGEARRNVWGHSVGERLQECEEITCWLGGIRKCKITH